jgi:RNA polymerase sigma factor (sigma-70 family)
MDWIQPELVQSDEIAELYRALSGRLERIVRVSIRAPEPVIEDACQIAWSRLVDRQDQIRRETALAWLATTARREALKVLCRQRRELSLEELGEDAPETPAGAQTTVEEIVEHRARLGSISQLSERQQRLVWLQGLGLSYVEMAGYTGASTRTVERQILRARRTLRAA